MQYLSVYTRKAKVKKKSVSSLGEDMNQVELSYIGGRSAKYVLWKTVWKFFVKLYIQLLIVSCDITHRYLLQRNEKYMSTQRLVNTIYNVLVITDKY